MQLKKNIIPGKNKIYIFYYLILSLLFSTNLFSSDISSITKPKILWMNNINFVEIKILDKISSKTSKLVLNLQQEKNFENLIIKVLKCKNSEFDDNPEVTAYIQVQDITLKNNDQVFVFNGWTFSSSPSLTLFDHPVYDIWLNKCY
tara:strand:+ start:1297 stop:1734 length:438 start_codon:yes stop_codon:yes gene_type:complete